VVAQYTEGLTRLIVHAPGRRLDVAFPAHLAVVTVLPGLLRRAGGDLADSGLHHDGWVLRRADGTVLDPAGTFAGQRVRDGEVLHLVPRRLNWPEAEYDDIVDAIAADARDRGRRWDGAATRAAGLTTTAVALAVALAVLLRSGPPWTVVAVVAVTVSVVLLGAGAVLARAIADAAVGAMVAASAVPFAFLGGLVLLVDEPLSQVGAPQVILGSALAAGAAVFGYMGTAGWGRVFVAAAAAAGCGVAGGLVSLPAPGPAAAAALVSGTLLLVSPMLPAAAVRLGRMPLPQLPRTPEDLIADHPLPDRRSIAVATTRADESLIGLLLGTNAATIGCFVVLCATGDTAARWLVATVALSLLLRGRFYAALRHRVPLLIAGLAGFVALTAFSVAQSAGPAGDSVSVALPIALAVAAGGVAAGLAYSGRPVSPRLGRLADVLDVVLTLAVTPLVCAILGLFGVMRGLFG
jgi:type VII secretion integral membrane protein EccD